MYELVIFFERYPGVGEVVASCFSTPAHAKAYAEAEFPDRQWEAHLAEHGSDLTEYNE